ncbi:MAG TPA: phosphate/phosphite/phosphonate ABC transporter substrate-binding protein [Micromonosporaceae bacterium]|nr:phosphate/phosphite/phosphonate ABC transporter substrate-binding protein [Micromonosporaceae bacterium]
MLHSNRRTPGTLALAAVAVLVLSGCGESAAGQPQGSGSGSANQARNPDTLVFAAVPSEEATSLEQSYKSVMNLLEKETGKKITFQKATDYAAIIEGQRSGKVDIAQYGPFSYVLARNSGVQTNPIGAQVKKKGEKPGYKSYAVTRAASPISDLAGFKGKKVCFVDPNSTSGYLYPRAGLMAAGIDPDKDLTAVMAGGHDASALAVASGQCDAGFAQESMIDVTLIDKGQLKPGDLKTVWKSEVIAGSPVAVSADLDPALQQKISAAFTEKANVDYLRANGLCGEKCQVGDGGSWGYVAVDDQVFDGVRKVCEVTRDKKCVKS